MCFGFDVVEFVTERNKVGVVRFEPLRIAVPSEEVWVCEDGSQKIQVCRNARDGCVLNGATGFADSIVPCTSCYDKLCNDTVEIRAYTGRNTVNERRVYADSIT